MNKLFGFDVRLKDLMNLGKYARQVPKLEVIFKFLESYWYTLEDKAAEEERWNNIRVGSVDVYLDKDQHLCMEFSTRFQFQNSPEVLKFLEKVKDA
jgi:hypothetical protein